MDNKTAFTDEEINDMLKNIEEELNAEILEELNNKEAFGEEPPEDSGRVIDYFDHAVNLIRKK